MSRLALLTVAVTASMFAQTSPLVIPHVADGGGWKSTVAIFNRNNTEPVRLFILFRSTEGTRLPLPVDKFGMISSLEIDLAIQGVLYLETLGASPNVQVGSVEINQRNGTSPVSGFAVFRQIVAGRPDYEAVSNGARGASSITFPFDNTNGLVTSFAMANLNSADCTIAVSAIFDEAGVPVQTGPRPIGALAPNGHAAFISTDRMPDIANKRGHLTFIPTLGCGSQGFAMLGLRFNPSGPFTNLLPLSSVAP